MIQALVHSLGTFIDIAALAVMIGTSLCILYLARPAEGPSEYPQVFFGRLRRLIVTFLSILVISTIIGLLGRGMEMSGLSLAASLPLLPTVVFKSHYGSMWLLRVAGLIVAWGMLIANRRNIGSPFFGGVLLLSGAAIAFSRSASGHPSDFGDFSPQQLADWLHLLAVSAWGGSLVALAVIFPASFVKDDNLQQRLVAITAERFYRAFGPLLTIIVFTGLYNAWFQIGSFQALTTTPYGYLFSGKLLLLIFLAFRYIAPPEQRGDEAQFVTKFLYRTRLEAVIILTLLLCVALLVHQIPARHFLHLKHMQASGNTGGTMHEDQMHHKAEGPKPVVVLDIKPASLIAGIPTSMIVRIKAPDGTPFKGITLMHERILHAVIISKDLDFFAHIHPEDIGSVTSEMIMNASFPLLFTFPRSGDYLLGLDFAADEGAYSRTLPIHVAKASEMGEPEINFSKQKNFDGYKVTLASTPGEIHSGEDAILRYIIEKNGKPVTDLEPFLWASMHLAIVSEDLKVFIHAHGSVPGSAHNHHDHMHAPPPPEKFGPEIESDIVFPQKGIYKVFSQVKHQDKVLLFDFMVKVQ